MKWPFLQPKERGGQSRITDGEHKRSEKWTENVAPSGDYNLQTPNLWQWMCIKNWPLKRDTRNQVGKDCPLETCTKIAYNTEAQTCLSCLGLVDALSHAFLTRIYEPHLTHLILRSHANVRPNGWQDVSIRICLWQSLKPPPTWRLVSTALRSSKCGAKLYEDAPVCSFLVGILPSLNLLLYALFILSEDMFRKKHATLGHNLINWGVPVWHIFLCLRPDLCTSKFRLRHFCWAT